MSAWPVRLDWLAAGKRGGIGQRAEGEQRESERERKRKGSGNELELVS